MTEVEWLACKDITELLVVVLKYSSPRKTRLLGCACAGWAWTWGLNEPSPELVSVAEAFADSLATKHDLVRAADSLKALRLECDEPYRPFPRTCELTELLASNRVYEVLEELHIFASDMSIVDDPGWQMMAKFVHDLFPNPFRPVVLDTSWLTATALALAQGIYDDKAFDRLPILADALQDAGCEDADILSHCRGGGPHVRGCWVVDLVLGKQ